MVLDTVTRNIVKSLKDNYSYEEIAQMLECDVESVVSCITETELSNSKMPKLKLRPLPELQNRREVGRPKVFENRKLVEQMLREHPHYTSIDVQRELISRFGIEVSRRTLQRRISEIRARQSPARNGTLSATVRQRRLEWARAHAEWTVQDWRNIFNMDDHKSTMGTMPKEIYVDTLLGPDCGDCKDLNLLEQLMNILQPKIQDQAPQNVSEFRSVLYDIWHSDQELVNKIEQLYETMAWRVEAVLQNGGAEIESS
ncbi:hypothetical protein AWZ03_009353 [Drosophila navojoa]|uniref:Transposase Tc1-like domain-containing protein n=1 Tax=Drosophila navojoa TaxID=7232 RepID=A0A484B641_DRONA|nr:uncharacterized protein LOC115563520 [Drosophila navojoa]TDG44233.1 hypothetical protein AWZ03_009353 [Drosophila navojoa]